VAGHDAAGTHRPWYVAHKALDTNTLHVVQGHDHPWLLSPWLEAADCSWVAGTPPAPGALAAKTRYRQADAACTLAPTPAGFRLEFAEPQWAVTPGQSAVLYEGEACLGGGVIAAAEVPPVVAALVPARAVRSMRRPRRNAPPAA
ncbi:MAG: aminomethyltransferase beta-barrel domain-containing protein, partial [Betaproteobacteria bacterium]